MIQRDRLIPVGRAEPLQRQDVGRGARIKVRIECLLQRGNIDGARAARLQGAHDADRVGFARREVAPAVGADAPRLGMTVQPTGIASPAFHRGDRREQPVGQVPVASGASSGAVTGELRVVLDLQRDSGTRGEQ